MSKNWQRCQLGDVLNLVNGRAYKKEEMLTEGVPILRIQNLNGGNKWFYSQLELAEDKYCYKDDLLYAWSATFGPYWSRWDHKLIYHYHIWKIETFSVLYKQFAYYALWNITEALKASAHGVAMPHITKAGMEAWEIELPPFAEQKIISEKLDTLLAKVDSAKARLEQIPQILKLFRQAVLAAAVSGKLITESDNKKKFTIGSLCFTSFDGPFGSKLKTSDYSDSGVRVVRLENIGHLEFKSEKETFISYKKYEGLSSNTLQENDLLFSSFVDEDVRVCLIPKSNEIFINKADCFCLRINPSLASPQYISLVLASKTSYEQIKERVQGITRPRINLRTLRSLTFDIPPLLEQQEIVRRVEQLFAYADTIEKQVNNALARVNNLTQSILAKAFCGELTAQWRKENPDLISGENSAAALLEKIKAERTASSSKKSSRKKT
ncbi:restriction endonuclease subunit S [Enterobacteriaceae bacterium RIT692]|nr:restriction endonuclease subunit S [Enterobacteriaceae bacterium RIT692]